MNTLLTLAVLLTLAAAWHALKRRIKEGPKARRVPSRKATMFAVMLVLGLQAIATAPAASAAACGEAPNPERPGAGMVGAIDPPEGHGEPNSAYIDYGYAGMVWNTFETDCSGINLTPAGSTLDSWGGNQLFNLGKNIVGATNSLHYTVLEGGLLNPIYAAVKSGAEKVYNNIYAQLFGLVALILSIMMFRNIWRGDLAAVSKRALYALAGIWLAASSLAMLRYFDPIDKAIVQTTTNIQAGFVDESGDRIVRDILPTQLHTQIVYNNWLRGEFGTPTAPQAEQYGKPLLDAQAFTRNQLVNGDDGNQGVIDGKKNAYKDISTKLGPATGYFTGEAGGRTGAGFLSLGQALVYSLFQLLAKASVLLAQVLIRLFALTAPLIGLVALLHPEILRRVLKVAGGVAFNLVVLSVLAGVHALLLQAIFDAGNSLNMLTQMVLAGLITVLLFMVGRPVRRLWQMVEMSVSMVGAAVPSPGGGIFSRFKRNRTGPTPQDEFWQNVRDTDDVVDGEQRGPLGATHGGGRFRPEATIFANAQRLDNTSGAGRPAAAWSGAWPGAINGGSAGALPAGGRPGSPVYGQYNPAGGDPGDYVVVGAGGRPTLRREESRRVDTSPVADRRWTDEPEPVVVPSDLRTPESGFSDYTPQDAPRTPGVRAQPRRVDPEVVAGKPVFVLYRPSRGIEVREEPRDTDQVMGR
ncbi:magnesium transporter [Amycolatopsis sp. RTGN1]|uniref:magnesium transporter n=1 Tax=Amycolatopsis ponsaeliensis TaxID=2992142 RepID=UPI002549FD4D|nr:magnesium transporter [Amycolatopsis sp. RTGN1]